MTALIEKFKGAQFSSVVLAYTVVFSALFGVLVSPLLSSGPASVHVNHSHALIEHMGGPLPEVRIKAEKDTMSGWNLSIQLEDFELIVPEASLTNEPNTGHAHLYINGEKVARLYGNRFHIPSLPRGDNELMVTLNSHSHDWWANAGKGISDSIVVTRH